MSFRRSPGAILLAGLLLCGATACTAEGPALGASEAPVVILFFGDSLTSGVELGTELAYPALLERRFREAGLAVRAVNAGVPGDTTADALARLREALAHAPDLAVVALGANDAFRRFPAERTRSNLERIVGGFQQAGTTVLIAGLKPVRLVPLYRPGLAEVYRGVARSTGSLLLDDLLKGVAGRPSMNLPDGIHPNVQGQRRIAANLWPLLSKTLAAHSDGR